MDPKIRYLPICSHTVFCSDYCVSSVIATFVTCALKEHCTSLKCNAPFSPRSRPTEARVFATKEAFIFPPPTPTRGVLPKKVPLKYRPSSPQHPGQAFCYNGTVVVPFISPPTPRRDFFATKIPLEYRSSQPHRSSIPNTQARLVAKKKYRWSIPHGKSTIRPPPSNTQESIVIVAKTKYRWGTVHPPANTQAKIFVMKIPLGYPPSCRQHHARSFATRSTVGV